MVVPRGMNKPGHPDDIRATPNAETLGEKEGMYARSINLPTLRDQIGWREMSGDKSAGSNLRDLNWALGELGDHTPQRLPANANEAPYPVRTMDPNVTRFLRALDGETPLQVQLPKLTVIEGGLPPRKN